MKIGGAFAVAAVILSLAGCVDGQEKSPVSASDLIQPSDPRATPEAAALLANLKRLSGRGVIFGHQETLAYGIGWREHEFDSDIKQTCGDFPGVFGWDLGEIGSEENIDHVPFQKMKTWVRSVYEKNGINTFSWHMRNFATGQNAWDTTPAVSRLLPGGDLHRLYCDKLDLVSDFLEIKGPHGESIPIVLRFFHEQNGGWFWWSGKSCTAEELKQLWRFTVDYFRNVKNQHQFLYCYSPDGFRAREDYLNTYPGDDYVDILAMDNYTMFRTASTRDAGIRMLETIVSLAEEKGKIAVLSETGVNKMPDSNWFTEVLLKALKTNERTRQIGWVLLWRNESTNHFFSTYPAHESAENFRAFYADPFTLFLSDLPDMYHRNGMKN